MLIAACIGFILLFVLNVIAFRRMSHPGVIQSFLWLFVFLAFTINVEEFNEISGGTITIFLCGSISFFLGCFLVDKNSRDKTPVPQESHQSINKRCIFAGCLTLAALLGLPFLVEEARRLHELSGADAFLVGVRSVLTGTEESTSYKVFGYLHSMNVAALCILAVEWYRGTSLAKTVIFFVSLGVAIPYGVLLTGRLYLFEVLIICLFPAMLLGKVGPIKTSVGLVLVFAVIFSVIGVVMGKGGSITDTFYENISGLFSSFFLLYLLSPIPSFDTVVTGADTFSFGYYTFRTVLAIGQALGLATDVPPLIQEFVYVPYPSNVYTMYSEYFKDFGLFGIMAAPALFGALHTWTYKRALTADPFYIALCTFLYFPLLLQTFQDMYFSLLSGWVQRLFLLWLAYRVFSRLVFNRTERTAMSM